MRFSHLSILVIVAILAILTATAEAGQQVKIGKKQGGKSTWFNGHDLKGAACYGDLQNKNVNAKDNWHIGAVHMKSYSKGEKNVCFQCAKITANKRSVVVRIIDDCAGCSSTQIDLTASAFKVLAPLSKGVVKTTYQWVKCPSGGKFWPSSPKPK
ncbi:hypothetical protein BGZ80_005250 [Entomortierella chlamydospora]|uniref:RlpA-like protein double-psi beta-barrel domain-containing protein n=1 Tax=Entomortierella chlamydospora TaxID=101097 RepID=A0A9P6N3V7_9FUNG|nr:hypothetical protein BGZ79_002623 [Entomortierella chlamydospora]KAG0024212.1 hypothetical protein BGZ80_005250 [Entomortierella chlamydospora]